MVFGKREEKFVAGKIGFEGLTSFERKTFFLPDESPIQLFEYKLLIVCIK
jgi:hypothetical protein